MRRILFAAIALAIPTAAAAADEDDGFCRNGGFPIENSTFGVATIQGAGRAYLLDDMNGCPNASPKCQTHTYLITGDRVVTGRTRGGYVCAYFPNKGGGSAGWVDPKRLKQMPVDAKPPLSAWAGYWSDNGNPTARFSVSKGELVVDGDSYWPQRNPSLKDYPGGPNVGDISGTLKVSGNSAHEPDCNVDFTLVGDMIVGRDPDMQCGGMNVSFSGVYRRDRH
jgi:hypothetical protein